MAGALLQPEEIGIDFIPMSRVALASIQIEGEGLVFDENDGSWHYLNPIAQVIWDCCDGSGTIDEIAKDISDVFDQSVDTVRQSVLETVQRFGQQGLLMGVEPGESGHSHAHGPAHTHDHSEDELSGDQPEANKPRFLAVPPSS